MKINYTINKLLFSQDRKQNYIDWKIGDKVMVAKEVHCLDEGDIKELLDTKKIYIINSLTHPSNEGFDTIRLKGCEKLFIARSFINLDVCK